MISERCRHKKSNVVCFHLYNVSRKGKFIKTESVFISCKGLGGKGNGKRLLTGMGFCGDDENVLKLDSSDGCTTW